MMGPRKNNLDMIQSWVPEAERSEAPDSPYLWRPLGSATGTRMVQLILARALSEREMAQGSAPKERPTTAQGAALVVLHKFVQLSSPPFDLVSAGR